MILDWLEDRRRAKILEEPFPASALAYLERNVPHYALLTEEEQKRLRDAIQIFIAEKYWEGCGGLEMTDEIRVTIAAQACLLVLGREHDFYPNVETILVYPASYFAPQEDVVGDWVVTETQSHRAGEAWSRGPIVLSWNDARTGGQNPNDGRNVVFHEFAHKLDLEHGSVDGVPRLEDDRQHDRWAEVMSAAYEELVEKTEEGVPTLLDDYGATEPAEFFAVATECFFEKPVQLRRRHPQLYEVLRGYYRQDPATRMEAATEEED